METSLIQDYKVFKGSYNAQMPKLVNGGLTSLTAKDVMQYRINAIQSNNQDEIDFWLNHYWDTITGLAYYNGNLIVQPNSQLLLTINPQSKLNSGSLVLSKEQFKGLSKQNEVISRNKIESGYGLTKQEAKEHPIWLKLAQEDKSLLNEYTDAIFAKAKEVYNYNENMGIYLPNDQDKPVMRGWYLRNLYNWSYANARDFLGSSNGRLLGVRAQNLEEVLEDLSVNNDPTKKLEIWIKLGKKMDQLVSQERYEEALKIKIQRDDLYKKFLG